MTRVPNIRGYEGFAEGVNWTPKLSLDTMVDFINALPNTPISRQLVNWLGKDHDGFSGYSDDVFDEINREAFKRLLELGIESTNFKPVYERIVGDEDTTDTQMELLFSGLTPSTSFTLDDLINSKAEDYALEYEPTDENKKLIGVLVGEALFKEGKSADELKTDFKEKVISTASKRGIGMADSDAEEEFSKAFSDFKLIEGMQAVFQGLMKNIKKEFVGAENNRGSYIAMGKEGSKPLSDFLLEMLPQNVGNQRLGVLMIPEYRDAQYKSMGQEEYLETILDMSTAKLVNLVNRSLKRLAAEKLNPFGLDGSILNLILQDIDAEINNSIISDSVVPAKEVYEQGQVGTFKRELDDEVVVGWFIQNQTKELNAFTNWLASGALSAYTYNNQDWNPLEISNIRGRKTIYDRKNTFRNKTLFADTRRDKGSQNILQRVDDILMNYEDFEPNKIRNAFDNDGLLDGIIDFFNKVDDELKSKESMYEVSDEERLFEDVSTIREDRFIESILKGETEEFLELINTAIFNLEKIRPPLEEAETEIFDDKEKDVLRTEDDALRLPMDIFEETQGFITDLKQLRREVNRVPTENIGQYENTVIRILNEQGNTEAANEIRQTGLENMTADRYSEISGQLDSGRSSLSFTKTLLKEYFGENFEDIQAYSKTDAGKIKIAKLLLHPILYGDVAVSDFGTSQEKNIATTLAYAGALSITLEFTSKGLEGEFIFEPNFEIKPEMGTFSYDFTVGRGLTREGERFTTPTGDKVQSFDTIFNKDKNRYMNEILKKLVKLQLVIRG